MKEGRHQRKKDEGEKKPGRNDNSLFTFLRDYEPVLFHGQALRPEAMMNTHDKSYEIDTRRDNQVTYRNDLPI